MKNVLHTVMLIVGLGLSMKAQTKLSVFKAAQLKNARVKNAYDTKWNYLMAEMKAKKINPNEFDIYLRAFKHEAKLEVWLKNKGEPKFELFKTYDICASSGSLGPKRKEGDGQVPEGFYKIDLFNPKSDYYLSLRVSYPNASDIILKEAPMAGGAIMIHGNCVTIGCLPMTDDFIKEIYVLCIEAKNRNNPINIDIYPAKFTEANMKMMEETYSKSKISFWNTLKPAYDYFEKHKWLIKVSVDKKGKYFFEE